MTWSDSEIPRGPESPDDLSAPSALPTQICVACVLICVGCMAALLLKWWHRPLYSAEQLARAEAHQADMGRLGELRLPDPTPLSREKLEWAAPHGVLAWEGYQLLAVHPRDDQSKQLPTWYTRVVRHVTATRRDMRSQAPNPRLGAMFLDDLARGRLSFPEIQNSLGMLLAVWAVPINCNDQLAAVLEPGRPTNYRVLAAMKAPLSEEQRQRVLRLCDDFQSLPPFARSQILRLLPAADAVKLTPSAAGRNPGIVRKELADKLMRELRGGKSTFSQVAEQALRRRSEELTTELITYVKEDLQARTSPKSHLPAMASLVVTGDDRIPGVLLEMLAARSHRNSFPLDPDVARRAAKAITPSFQEQLHQLLPFLTEVSERGDVCRAIFSQLRSWPTELTEGAAEMITSPDQPVRERGLAWISHHPPVKTELRNQLTSLLLKAAAELPAGERTRKVGLAAAKLATTNDQAAACAKLALRVAGETEQEQRWQAAAAIIRSLVDSKLYAAALAELERTDHSLQFIVDDRPLMSAIDSRIESLVRANPASTSPRRLALAAKVGGRKTMRTLSRAFEEQGITDDQAAALKDTLDRIGQRLEEDR